MTGEDIDLDSPEENEETYSLWDIHKPLYDVFKVVEGYLVGEFYSLDASLLVTLFNARGMDLELSLYQMTILHSSYQKELLEYVKQCRKTSNKE